MGIKSRKGFACIRIQHMCSHPSHEHMKTPWREHLRFDIFTAEVWESRNKERKNSQITLASTQTSAHTNPEA